jgi:hypothetical protein
MSDFIYPTSARAVSDSFQDHVNRGSVNPGTDYEAPYGSDVVAVASGIVTDSDNDNGGSGGRVMHIDHDNGWGTDYLHMSSCDVPAGTRVSQGQRIGASGASGEDQDWYYGPHLHISLRPNHSHGYGNVGNVDFALHVGEGGGSSAPGFNQTVQNEQAWMISLGISCGPSGADGIRGDDTINAIKQYQEMLRPYGYTGDIDGVWGSGTQAAHEKLYAEKHAAPPAASNPFGIGDVQGLQKVARIYGYSGAIDHDWGAGSAGGFAQFLRVNWSYSGNDTLGPVMWASIASWLRAKYSYVGNDIPGPDMRAALSRANDANMAAL